MTRAVFRIPRTQAVPLQTEVSITKRKAAAYARVSTDLDDQQTSYERQVSYYTEFIQKRDDWEFVNVYTDEGISGTSTRHREGFKQMINDALDGKIDLIITKSISRFARNTIDTLTAIRQLKEKNIEVYFEKENIWTLDGISEVLLTIMSSLAQEESRSISENVTWGIRRRFAEGKVSVNYSMFLGYDKDFNIIESEAQIVRQIYQWFLMGYTFAQIARKCTKSGYKTPSGKPTWHINTVKSILTNEKYKGDALLQKGYTVDYLTKKKIKNDGSVQQYYVKDHHDPIISTEVFDKVQALMGMKVRRQGDSPFSGIIICGECGATYGPRVWHSTDKYRKRVWVCHDKAKSPHKVSHLTESGIQNAFSEACGELIRQKEEILPVLQETLTSAFGVESLEQRKQTLQEQRNEIIERIDQMVEMNAIQLIEGSAYDLLGQEYQSLEDEIGKLNQEIKKRQKRLIKIEVLFQAIRENNPEWSEDRFRMMVEQITVHHDKTLSFKFWDGTEITVGA